MLTRAGYRVVAAANAGEALELAAELGGAYDAVVSDVVMPGGSGLDLAQELDVRHGERPLLLVSGFNAETVDAHREPPGRERVPREALRRPGPALKLRSLLDA